MSIAGLNTATPGANDSAGLGDDQIRDLKSAIKACFGGVAGPVKAGTAGSLATDVQLTALFDRITTLEALLIGESAAVFIPGHIMLWYGSTASIPLGWKLCDGTVYGSLATPDLTDRYVYGAGGALSPNASGGSVNATTVAGGNHNHGGATDDHTLTIGELPSGLPGALRIPMSTGSEGLHHFEDNACAGAGDVPSSGSATANVSGSGFNSEGHGHAIDASGTHTHTILIVPPYYALCYIMYVGE
jgi:hypothetical protein